MSTHPFIIERTFNAPANLLWCAISDRDQMKQWYFDIPGFVPETGREFGFDADCDGHVYHHIFKITESVPGSRLSYSWRYGGQPGESHVTFELFAEGERTRLRLTHAGLETFDSTNPDFERKSFEEGWAFFLETALAQYLSKQLTPQ